MILKPLIRRCLHIFYHAEIKNIENYYQCKERMLIIANHSSFLDALLLAVFLPDKLTFAINTNIAKQWWLKPFLLLVETFPVDPTNPLSTRSIIKAVEEGKRCVIFPEGRLTVTGALMKVYEGPAMIADNANAYILPIRIDGAIFTPFSKMRNKIRIRWFPKITLTVLEPIKFEVPDKLHLHSHNKRRYLGQKLYEVMLQMVLDSSNYQQTLFATLLDARKIHKRNLKIIEDAERKPLTYNQFITRCFIVGSKVAEITKLHEFVGILLPTMASTMIVFFAMQTYGRIPAMLNYSTGKRNILHACRIANIRFIFTSRRFVGTAKLEPLIAELENEQIKIIYLEELLKGLSLHTKIVAALKTQFADKIYKKMSAAIDPSQPAVVLFTSGSEGIPKGVALSHSNIQANRVQLTSCVDFTELDVAFNALPIFHCFGLTAGGILPLLSGFKTFCYPSPLHYRVIPELAYDINATIFFGTDTFLSGYARYAHSYDFYSVRYLFAGAEKLKEQTFKLWSEKFSVRILEGYGATETSPVLATNTPMRHKTGTVGVFLPGISYKLEPVPGIHEGGRLWVKGPNIMLGYLDIENPGQIKPLPDGWYDTGDIVKVDEEGYVIILGRAKRFAKIGGEMVSLTMIEVYITELWPQAHHAVLSISSDKKGEQLVLLTDLEVANREELVAFAKQQGIAEIAIPKKIIHVAEMPILVSGKVDYPEAQSLLENLLSNEID